MDSAKEPIDASCGRDDTSVTVGSGNVFRDLGFADGDAELMQAKSALVSGICSIIDSRGWSVQEACSALKLTDSQLERFRRGKMLRELSLDWLVHRLAILGKEVEIAVGDPLPRAKPALRVIIGAKHE